MPEWMKAFAWNFQTRMLEWIHRSTWNFLLDLIRGNEKETCVDRCFFLFEAGSNEGGFSYLGDLETLKELETILETLFHNAE